MMTSLLSVFDPCSSVLWNLNWMSPFFLFFISTFYMIPSMFQQSFFIILKLVTSLFKEGKNSALVFVCVFFFLLIMNLMGLMPYFFSATSHLFFNLSFSLTLWLATVLWGFTKNFDHNIAHLTPMGCPSILVPFMVLVELVSSLIRPLTLSLRLMSNILAGHLILTLISKGVFSFYNLPSLLMFLLHSGFFMFEIGVAFIQAYVFSSLLHLYWLESE
nr:ATP synthase F0 subunit 6 [Actornithophilus gracilis]